MRPLQEFSFKNAQTKLISLNLRVGSGENTKFLVPGDGFSHEQEVNAEELGFTDQQGKLLFLAGVIDMDNRASIGCAGALVTYLQRKRSAECLQGDPAADQSLRIDAIEMLSLEGTMFVHLLPSFYCTLITRSSQVHQQGYSCVTSDYPI